MVIKVGSAADLGADNDPLGLYPRRQEPARSSAAPAARSKPRREPPSDVYARAAYVRDRLREVHGFPEPAATAIGGHAIAESNVRTHNPGDAGHSNGIVQWHKERLTAGKNWAKSRNRDWNDLDTQVDYLAHELRTKETYAYSQLQRARSVDEATAAFMHFERPAGYTRANPKGGHNFSGRLAYARRLAGIQGGAGSNTLQGGERADSIPVPESARFGGGEGTDSLGDTSTATDTLAAGQTADSARIIEMDEDQYATWRAAFDKSQQPVAVAPAPPNPAARMLDPTPMAQQRPDWASPGTVTPPPALQNPTVPDATPPAGPPADGSRVIEIDEDQYETWKRRWDSENQSTGIVGDTYRLLTSGMDQLALSTRWIAQKVPVISALLFQATYTMQQRMMGNEDAQFPERVPRLADLVDAVDAAMGKKPLPEAAKERGEYIEATLTPAQREARKKEWVTETVDADGKVSYGVGPAWRDPRAYYGAVVESLPATVASMGPAAVVARGVYLGAVAKGASVGTAAARAATAATIAGATTEGLLGGADTARAVAERIASLDPELVRQSEAIQVLVKSGMTEREALQKVATDAETTGFVLGGIATGVFGGAGDRALAKIIAEGVGGNIARRIAGGSMRGAVSEGVFEEMPQSAGAKVAENYAVQTVDPSQRLTEGVANEAAGGLAAGAAMGAGFGAAGGVARPAQDLSATPGGGRPAVINDPADPSKGIDTAGEMHGQPVTILDDQSRAKPGMVVIRRADGQLGQIGENLLSEPPQSAESPPAEAGAPAAPAPAENSAPPAAAAPTPAAPQDATGAPPSLRAAIAGAAAEKAKRNGIDPTAPAAPVVPPSFKSGDQVRVTSPDMDPYPAQVVEILPDGEALVLDTTTGEYLQVPVADIAPQTDALLSPMPESGTATTSDEDAPPPISEPADGASRSADEAKVGPAGKAPFSAGPAQAPTTDPTSRTVRDKPVRFARDADARLYDYGEKLDQGRQSKMPMKRVTELLADDAKQIAADLGIDVKDVPSRAAEWRRQVRLAAKDAKTGQEVVIPEFRRAAPPPAPQPADSIPANPDSIPANPDSRVAQIDAELAALDQADIAANNADSAADRIRELAANKKRREALETERDGLAPVLSPVDVAAKDAATSPTNDLPEPTAAQKEAGNYRKGHATLAGLDLSIENPVGSTRSGTDRNGTPWEVTMKSHYGYIKGTTGKDKDHIDVFIAPGITDTTDDAPVFVIDQVEPSTKTFDEHKVMIGFPDQKAARAGYLANYAKGWKGLGTIRQTTLGEFKTWLSTGDTTKPFAKAKLAAEPAAPPKARPPEPTQASKPAAPVDPVADARAVYESGAPSNLAAMGRATMAAFDRYFNTMPEAEAEAAATAFSAELKRLRDEDPAAFEGSEPSGDRRDDEKFEGTITAAMKKAARASDVATTEKRLVEALRDYDRSRSPTDEDRDTLRAAHVAFRKALRTAEAEFNAAVDALQAARTATPRDEAAIRAADEDRRQKLANWHAGDPSLTQEELDKRVSDVLGIKVASQREEDDIEQLQKIADDLLKAGAINILDRRAFADAMEPMAIHNPDAEYRKEKWRDTIAMVPARWNPQQMMFEVHSPAVMDKDDTTFSKFRAIIPAKFLKLAPRRTIAERSARHANALATEGRADLLLDTAPMLDDGSRAGDVARAIMANLRDGRLEPETARRLVEELRIKDPVTIKASFALLSTDYPGRLTSLVFDDGADPRKAVTSALGFIEEKWVTPRLEWTDVGRMRMYRHLGEKMGHGIVPADRKLFEAARNAALDEEREQLGGKPARAPEQPPAAAKDAFVVSPEEFTAAAGRAFSGIARRAGVGMRFRNAVRDGASDSQLMSMWRGLIGAAPTGYGDTDAVSKTGWSAKTSPASLEFTYSQNADGTPKKKRFAGKELADLIRGADREYEDTALAANVAAAGSRQRKIPRDATVSPLKEGVDLGIDTVTFPNREAAIDYVLQKGQATGVEYGVGLDQHGDVIWHVRGTENLAPATALMKSTMHDESETLDLIHYHPQGTALSVQDISLLGLPGTNRVTAVSAAGRSTASITPKGRSYFSYLVRSAGYTDDQRVVAPISTEIEAKTQTLVTVAKAVLAEQGNESAKRAMTKRFSVAHSEVIARALGEAGIIYYDSGLPVHDYLDDRRIRAEFEKLVKSLDDEARYAAVRTVPRGDDRPAEPVRAPDRVGGAPTDAVDAPPERSDDRGADAGREPQDRPDAGRVTPAPAAAPATPEQFANNKIFTADKVEAARARLKAKLSQLNSGIDPEVLIDGMTIAGAYVESGVRKFGDYAAAMTADFGDAVKPYLLSFYEAIRAYPGLDTADMTPADEALKLHQALNNPPPASEAVAIGNAKPAKPPRAKAKGDKSDTQLRQDFGVDHIDAYSDEGEAAKAAFLKDATGYLKAVADILSADGWGPKTGRKGKPMRAVSASEGGVAGSGDVVLHMLNASSGITAYVTIGESALRGVVPMTKSGITVMMRVGQRDYGTDGGNNWMPVEMTAGQLAAKIGTDAERYQQWLAKREAGETPATATATATERSDEPAELDRRRTGAPEGTPAAPVPSTGQGGETGGAPVAGSGADVRGDRPVGAARNPSGRSVPDGPGTAPVPAGGVAPTPPTAINSVPAPTTAAQAPVDFAITDEDAIGEGGIVTKFRQNIAAIKLLRTLEQEQRAATRDEQAVLAKWVGWGGMPQAFAYSDGTFAKGWEQRASELKELLTDEEYAAAIQSTQNAHYTAPTVVREMWRAVKRLGYTGGRVLEPSVGSGNFIGMAPAALRNASQFTAVELDTITGNLAKHIYPKANVKVMGFETITIPDDYFDVAIGNPPFGSTRLYDPLRPEASKFSIHNFFFAKSVETLRPGGVLAMVVSNFFLDAGTSTARDYIASKARFLGAIRLPNDAFKANANTEVTTDIVFLQKRDPNLLWSDDDVSWLRVGTFRDAEGRDVNLNNYFLKNPSMMLGKFGAYGTMYGKDSGALISREGDNLGELLAVAIDKLPQNVMPSASGASGFVAPEKVPSEAADAVIGSAFITKDGEIYVRGPDILGDATATIAEFRNGPDKVRATGMIRVRDAFTALRRLQIDAKATDKDIEAARKRLNTAYDTFVAKHGPLNISANKRVFRDDPTWPQISALESSFDPGLTENQAAKTGEPVREPSAEKAPVFSKRTMFPYSKPTQASSAEDALAIVLSDKARIDIEAMQRLYPKSEQDIVAELGARIFAVAGGGYETSDAYLSGNVKAKLAEAKKLAERDPSFERNVSALEAVQPADIEAVDISVKPGASWIPQQDVIAFLDYITGSRGSSASFSAFTGSWSLSFPPGSRFSDEATLRYSTDRVRLQAIVEAAFADKDIKVYDRDGRDTPVFNPVASQAAMEKVEAVKKAWDEWVWQDDDRRARLHRIYNDTFNTDVRRQFDGSLLTLPGKVADDVINLRPHQKNAIWRVLQSSTTLFDHTVGAGKTFAGVASIMELRRTGLARKPLVVVPNHLVKQWAADFVKLYPNAKVLFAEDKDFAAGNRQRFLARVAAGDFDAVIIAHSSFKKIPIDPRFEQGFIEQQIRDMEAAIATLAQGDSSDKRNAKKIAKKRDTLKTKLLKSMDAGNKDVGLTFNEIGFDALLVDEAHEFKNLPYVTSHTRVAGLGNPTGSQKAVDMYMKIAAVKERTGGRNILFMTGTPISNTMAEMFTMQRYLDEENLRRLNIGAFDAWAKVFATITTEMELSPAGKYKPVKRFAKFVNMPELMARYLSFADVITNPDIQAMLAKQGKKLPIPKVKGGKPQNIVVPRSPAQAAYVGVPLVDENGNEAYPIGSLVHRSENLPKGPPQKGDDNMLKIMSDARKAALDMRLIDLDAADFPKSKSNVAADRMVELWRRWDAEKGAQLVFIDLSTPKAAASKERDRINELLAKAENGDEDAEAELEKMSPDEFDALTSQFSVYDDLRDKLIRRGVPPEQVAFIHDANTDLRKEELFGKVRSGRVRFLFGSTAKMGAGTNVQNRLVGLHHMDAPWRPSDMEQREGRIIRQGNELYAADPDGFEVEISRYATEGTLDARMYQTIEKKAEFIEQLRRGAVTDREIDDIGGEAANSAEMKAAASGNPLVLEEVELRTAIRKLENSQKEFQRAQFSVADQARRLRADIDSLQAQLPKAEKLAAMAQRAREPLVLVVDDARFEKPGDIGKAINDVLLQGNKAGRNFVEVGTVGDFAITAEWDKTYADWHVRVTKDFGFGVVPSPDAPGTGIGIKLKNAIDKIAGSPMVIKADIEDKSVMLARREKERATFPAAEELEEKKKRHREVLEALRPKRQDQSQAPAKPETPDGLAESSPVYMVPPPGQPSRMDFIRAIKGKLTDLQPSALALVPLNYFTELARPNMTAIADYMRVKRMMDAFRGHKHAQWDEIAKRWLSYTRMGVVRRDRAKAAELAKLMHDSTLAAADPTVDSAANRQNTAWPELRRRFNALPSEGQALYRDVRDAYVEQQKESDEILLDNIRKLFEIAQKRAEKVYRRDVAAIEARQLSPDARAAALEDAAKAFKIARARAGQSMKARITMLRKKFEASRVPAPYFPLGRFGRYFVTVRDVDGSVLSFSKRETKAEIDRLAADMRAAYPTAEVAIGVMDEREDAREAMDPRIVAEVEEILSGLGLTPNDTGTVLDQIWQRYLETLPDLSVRKRFIHRKGTAGYDADALRVFSNHMFHAAHQMAKLKYGTELTELVNDIRDQAKESDDQVRGTTLANEMARRHEWVMKPQGGRFAQAINSLAFTWYLATTPAAAVVNMTQTPIMGQAILGARFGERKAAAALLKASADSVRGRGLPSKRKNMREDERAAMTLFYDSGLVDRSQAHDIAGVGETGVQYSPLRSKIMGIISWAFHNAEVWNREVTALAAYRLARAAGQDFASAVETAHDMTYKAHFDYSASSRPRATQNDTAKVVLVFRAHNINMLYRLFRDIHQSVKGESAQARREARRQLAGIVGMMALWAGASGIPAFHTMMFLAGLVFGGDDDPFDFETRFRDDVVDVLGPELAGVVLDGVPGSLFGVDLTSRIGMPDLWFRGPNRDLDGRDAFEYWVMNSLGASVSMLGGFVRGFELVNEGDIGKGIEAAVPKVVRDQMRAWRYAFEGVTTPAGDTIIGADNIDVSDIVAQSLGFTPAKIAEQYERNNALKNAETRVQKARRRAIDAYVAAVQMQDADAIEAAKEQVGRFNASPYARGIEITGETIRRSMQTRNAIARKRVDGVLIQNRALGQNLRSSLPERIYD